MRKGETQQLKSLKKAKGGKGSKGKGPKDSAVLELDSNDTDLAQIDGAQRPAAGSDEMKAWNAGHMTDGKPHCWSHFNGGNCSLGAKCRFAHIK